MLKKLQDIDLVLREASNEIRRLQEFIRKNDAELEELREKVKQLNEELKEKEITKRKMENEIRADEEVVKRWENRSKEIKSGREYQALMREIALTKKEISDKETELITLIDEIEQKQKVLEGLQAELKDRDNKWGQEKEELKRKILENERKSKESREKRESLVKAINPSLLQRYERIGNQRDGIAIVEARDYTCMGCNMNIPPQVYNQVLKRESIVSCPYCQRILFIPQEEKVNV